MNQGNPAAVARADRLGVEPPDLGFPSEFGLSALRCPEPGCNRSFTTPDGLRQHSNSKMHQPNRFPCPNNPPCGKFFVTKQSAEGHKARKHDKAVFITCKYPGCGKKCKGKETANRHYRNMHTKAGQKHKCATCGKGFGAPSHLKIHEQGHNNERRKLNTTGHNKRRKLNK